MHHFKVLLTTLFFFLSTSVFSQPNSKPQQSLDSLRQRLLSSLNEQIQFLQKEIEWMQIAYKNDRHKIETEKAQVLNFWLLQSKYRASLDSLELGILEFPKNNELVSISDDKNHFYVTITKTPNGLEGNPYYNSIYGNIPAWLYPGYFLEKAGIFQDDSISDLEKRYPNVFRMRANELHHRFPSISFIEKTINLAAQFPKNEGKLPRFLHLPEIRSVGSASGDDPIENLYFKIDSLQQLHNGLHERVGAMDAQNEQLDEVGDLVNFWMIQDQYRFLLDALELGKNNPTHTLSGKMDRKDFFWSEAKNNRIDSWGSIIVDPTLKNRLYYNSEYDTGLKLVMGDPLLKARYPKVFKMLGKEIAIVQTEKNPVFQAQHSTAASIGRLQIPSFFRKNSSLEAKKKLADDLYNFIVNDTKPIQVKSIKIKAEVEEFKRLDKGYPANFSEKKIDEFILIRRTFIEYLKKLYEKN